jgi:pimeloyl-ACP methyl ester carboxylesterase
MGSHQNPSVPAEDTLDVGGRVTRVALAGDGPPLLWLHDTLGNCWTAAHDRLSRSHTVIAPSLPGFDDSTTLDGIDSPEDVAFWLLDLLHALGTYRPAVLGCGLGGWMAAELAVRAPERIERLVLVDAYGLKVDGALAQDEFALTPGMLRPLLFADPAGAIAQDTLPDQPRPERVESALHARVAAARLAWQFPYSRKLRSRLWRARMPALVVWGDLDRLIPSLHADAYAQGLAHAQLAIMPGTGHYPYVEEPHAFGELVETFLAAT